MGTRLDQTMVDAAIGDLDGTDVLAPSTIVALELADVLTSAQPVVSPELHARLRRHYSDEQILELGSALAVASGWQRFIEAFGIRPDHWVPGQAPPQRPGDS